MLIIKDNLNQSRRFCLTKIAKAIPYRQVLESGLLGFEAVVRMVAQLFAVLTQSNIYNWLIIMPLPLSVPL